MRILEGSGPRSGLFTRQGLPVFGTFFIWGTGGGAQTVGLALFGYLLTDSFFLVGVLSAVVGISNFISGPLSGYLTDHLGRKPLAIAGAMTRGVRRS